MKMKRYVRGIDEATLEALQTKIEIAEAITNNIPYQTDCRVKEPKLWEERYF